jgi:Domain of unknown function (DUF4331)
MSSHREAPQISQDPVADSTDLYAFRSPDKPGTVTLIANYIPLQAADGGPNFYEFGEDVTYDINIDNQGTGTPSITYRFRFTTTNHIPTSFLYNDGPITSLTGKGAAAWNRRQNYTLTRLDWTNGAVSKTTTLAEAIPCPPCNIGPLSTPDYAVLASEARHSFSKGGYSGEVFAGQRAEGFYVDLGSIFDLGTLRPFQTDHARFGLQNTGLGKMATAVNATRRLNVHSLALQIPIHELTSSGRAPSSHTSADAVIGVWTAASRPAVRTYEGTSNNGHYVTDGALEQVSRLGNPLVNEVIIPLGKKDLWNASTPAGDSSFIDYFVQPELAGLLPVLYPGVFPHLAKYNAGKVERLDIAAIFNIGIPAGLVKGFQNALSKGGDTYAEMLRLNVFFPPAKKPNVFGLLGGDVAGFPNGRRVFDDVVTIELRALAGAVLKLVDPTYSPDGPASGISEGLTSSATDLSAMGTENYLPSFPYLGVPHSGFLVPAS